MMPTAQKEEYAKAPHLALFSQSMRHIFSDIDSHGTATTAVRNSGVTRNANKARGVAIQGNSSWRTTTSFFLKSTGLDSRTVPAALSKLMIVVPGAVLLAV